MSIFVPCGDVCKGLFHALYDTLRADNPDRLAKAKYLWPEPPQEVKDALPKNFVMARDEARHGKAFEGLLKRYFGK